MRTLILIAAAGLLGIVLGAGSSWARIGRQPDFASNYDLLVSVTRDSALPSEVDGPKAHAVVDDDEHNFGKVERNAVVEHPFRITNEGDAPLTLNLGGTTCGKCTFGELTKKLLAPGESTAATVRYDASIGRSQFRTSAIILTNDPLRPQVWLTVYGKVVGTVNIDPSNLVFSSVPAGTQQTATARVFATSSDDFQLDSPTWSDAETAALFAVELTPLKSTELAEANARQGYSVAVTIRPGLPVGPVHQRLLLASNLPSMRTIEIPVEAQIVSDISIAGQGWDRENGRLAVGVIKSAEGFKRMLFVSLYGPHRQDTQLSVGECEPSYLKATLGKPVASGEVVRVPLTIEIPPGLPSADHLGTSGKAGRVILDTTHPDAKQLRISVLFAVED